MTEHTRVFTVNNILETRNKIDELEREGTPKEKIFVLTWSGTIYDNENFDPNIGYFGYVPML